jgi:hypothetical protein
MVELVMRRNGLLIVALTVALVGCSSASEGGEGDPGVSGPDGIEGATDASGEEGTETTEGTEGKDSEDALVCVTGGCDSELCHDAAEGSNDAVCDPKPEHACLSLTTCGVLGDGTCGWEQNDTYLACLEEAEEGEGDAGETSDGDGEPMTDSETGPTDTEAVDDSEVEPPQDTAGEDTSAPVGDDAGPMTDVEVDLDGGATSDVMDATAEDVGEADAGSVTLVDEIVPITEESQYDKGELYGMGVDPEGRVSIFWRAERADGLHDLVVSQSDIAVSGFEAPVAVVEGVAPLGITAGGGLEMDGPSHLLTWRDDPSDGVSRIMFRRAEMPALEGEDLILSESNTHTLYRPHVAWRAPSTACVLWQKSGGNDSSDVMMRCSADGGVTFDEELMINPIEATASVSDAVFAFSGELYVAYHAKPTTSAPVRVYVRVSADMGLTWSEPLDMSTLGGAEEGFDPTLARGMDGILHLGWYNGLPGLEGQAWISHLEAGGTWTTPELMPTIQSQIALRPGRGSVLHASGEDAKFGYGCIANPPPDCGIQVMSSYDSGLIWGEADPLPVTPDTTLLGHDMVANLTEGYLHIAWWETLPNQMTKMALKFITVEE